MPFYSMNSKGIKIDVYNNPNLDLVNANAYPIPLILSQDTERKPNPDDNYITLL